MGTERQEHYTLNPRLGARDMSACLELLTHTLQTPHRVNLAAQLLTLLREPRALDVIATAIDCDDSNTSELLDGLCQTGAVVRLEGTMYSTYAVQ